MPENRPYVFCEDHASKWQGGLFQKVLNDLGIPEETLFHIGDAKRSDFLMPKKYGISTMLAAERGYHRKKQREILYDIGFFIFGLLFYEFTVWLYGCVKYLFYLFHGIFCFVSSEKGQIKRGIANRLEWPWQNITEFFLRRTI